MRNIFLSLGLLIALSANAQDIYSFHSKQQQQQFNQLTQELRCLVCQNESLDASNASLAVDLRNEVYAMVQAGKSSEEIKKFLVARYGNFILFKPPFMLTTYVLWLAPFLLLILAAWMLFIIIRRQKKSNKQIIALTVEEQKKIEELLS